MCLAQAPQRSDAGEARPRGPSISSQALYLWATALPNWLSIIVIQVHAKLHNTLYISTCSLHWNINSSWEVCENLFYGEKRSFIEWTYVVGAHWNCLYEAVPMCTSNICYCNMTAISPNLISWTMFLLSWYLHGSKYQRSRMSNMACIFASQWY